jgi:hypothetical protein
MSGRTVFSGGIGGGLRIDRAREFGENVRIDGNGLVLSVILETSLVNGTVTTKNSNGVETEEPIISQRNLELAMKLPFETPKVIFDSDNMETKLTDFTRVAAEAKISEEVRHPTLQIEMTAKELRSSLCAPRMTEWLRWCGLMRR